MRICTTCVTPDSYPGTILDGDGVCNHCRDFERRYKNWENTREERLARFEHFVQWARKQKKPYDALVPLSGGKDSTYVLYLATKKYGLRVLCYTFDNGFQTNVAQENVKEAVERSGADHIIIKPSRSLMMNLYKHFLKHTGLFCPVCMRGIYAGTFSLVRAFDIPLVLKGTSERTEEKLVPEIFQDGRYSFFRNVLKANPFPEDVKFLNCDRGLLHKLKHGMFILSGQRIPFGVVEIQLPDFVDWDYRAIFDTISKEMAWKPLPDRNEHIDCLVEPVAHYLRKIRVPDLTTNTLHYSAQIRAGMRDRQTALNEIEQERRMETIPKELDDFMEGLNISNKEMQSYLDTGFKHMRYQKKSLAELIRIRQG